MNEPFMYSTVLFRSVPFNSKQEDRVEGSRAIIVVSVEDRATTGSLLEIARALVKYHTGVITKVRGYPIGSLFASSTVFAYRSKAVHIRHRVVVLSVDIQQHDLLCKHPDHSMQFIPSRLTKTPLTIRTRRD